MARCSRCGAEFVQNVGRGRKASFCGGACRVAWHRGHRVPDVLRAGCRWVRADGKRPIMPNGRPASSTDRGTWSEYAAVQSGAGDGFGIMLGDGLGCYDLDRVSDARAREFIATIPEPVVFVERSMSGAGVHVFVQAEEGPGHSRSAVERYTRARFIRVTGVRFQ